MQDAGVYLWRCIVGPSTNRTIVRIPRRRKVAAHRRRRGEEQGSPASASDARASDSDVSTEASSAGRKPLPVMLKKLAAPAKAVAHFTSRATTNLRKNSVDRVKPDVSTGGNEPLRRRLSFSSIQRAVPAVVGRRRAMSDAAASAPSSSLSSSASSTSTTSESRGPVTPLTSDSGPNPAPTPLPAQPLPKWQSSRTSSKATLERQPSSASAKPTIARRLSSVACKLSIHTQRPSKADSQKLAHARSRSLRVGAVLVKSSPKGRYDLIRTSIDEVPEEEESDSDGYTSTESSLSADSGGVDSMRSSMDSAAGEIGQPTASGPLGTLRSKLQRTMTAMHKPQLVVG